MNGDQSESSSQPQTWDFGNYLQDFLGSETLGYLAFLTDCHQMSIKNQEKPQFCYLQGIRSLSIFYFF